MTARRFIARLRWLALRPVGPGGLACLACCTLPLWIAGGLTLTGSAVALDICKVSWLPTLLIAGAVAAATILLTRSLRRRRHQRCATAGAVQD
jgi:hypothetical protein